MAVAIREPETKPVVASHMSWAEAEYERHICECDRCANFPLNAMCEKGDALWHQVKREAVTA